MFIVGVEVARGALTDMRAMLGVLRTEEPSAGLAPQPGIDDLGALVERIRATGLPVDLSVEGAPFRLGAAAELTSAIDAIGVASTVAGGLAPSERMR